MSVSVGYLPSLLHMYGFEKKPLIPKWGNAAPSGSGISQLADLLRLKLDLCTDFLSLRGRHDPELSRGAKQKESVHCVPRVDIS